MASEKKILELRARRFKNRVDHFTRRVAELVDEHGTDAGNDNGPNLSSYDSFVRRRSIRAGGNRAREDRGNAGGHMNPQEEVIAVIEGDNGEDEQGSDAPPLPAPEVAEEAAEGEEATGDGGDESQDEGAECEDVDVVGAASDSSD